MKIEETKFKDLFILKNNHFSDNRGSFAEIYRNDLLNNKLSYRADFCQHNLVNSKKNVLRGLHFQKPPFSQSKLITVVKGKILDVVVDIRKNSDTYGKYFSITLTDDFTSLFIPKGFAHGYLTISENAVISYLVDNYYNPLYEENIHVFDNFLNINWEIDKDDMIISKKDMNANKFKW